MQMSASHWANWANHSAELNIQSHITNYPCEEADMCDRNILMLPTNVITKDHKRQFTDGNIGIRNINYIFQIVNVKNIFKKTKNVFFLQRKWIQQYEFDLHQIKYNLIRSSAFMMIPWWASCHSASWTWQGCHSPVLILKNQEFSSSQHAAVHYFALTYRLAHLFKCCSNN